MLEAGNDQRDPFFRLARAVASAGAMWHRVQVAGMHNLPRGPALLVGNHGLYGFETPVFFYTVYRATGRVPVGLADRLFFGAPPIRRLLQKVGGVPGTKENALELLEDGRLVVCYPGGSREVFKPPEARYRLQWGKGLGFAQVAIAAGVPVIPFAGIGVDDTYINLGHLPLSRRLLGRYAVPVAVGLGALPLPVQLRFRIGQPLTPPRDLHQARTFKLRVQLAVEALLEVHVPHAQRAATAIP